MIDFNLWPSNVRNGFRILDSTSKVSYTVRITLVRRLLKSNSLETNLSERHLILLTQEMIQEMMKEMPTTIQYNKHFRYAIVHEETIGVVKETGMPGTYTKTWNYIAKPFTWEITRPETGEAEFLRTCPYCGKSLKISLVYSVESILAKQKRDRKLSVISPIATLVFLAIFIISLNNSSIANLLMAFSFFGFIIFGFVWFATFTERNSFKSPAFGSGDAGGELHTERLNSPNGDHYIKSKEGY
jgi:hypothetical protein